MAFGVAFFYDYVQISLSLEDRIREFDLRPDRADVIVPAAQIFITIARLVCANCIAVPTIGLADGIIGIFVSVAIAFTFGALVQWLNHALLMQSLNGPAKTSTYFLIIAGIIMSRQRSISK